MGIEEVGFCGLSCGGCALRAGIPLDPAELRKAMRRVEFRGPAEALRMIPFLRVMAGCPVCLEMKAGEIVMRCPRSCRQGGGNPSCEIRLCCTRRELEGCWQCPGFEDCHLLATLVPAHGSESITSLRRIRDMGIAACIAAVRPPDPSH